MRFRIFAGQVMATMLNPIRRFANSSKHGIRNMSGQKFAISSTSTAFSAFEERYGSDLQQLKGDLTPYWEDGAGSSALETRMNRVAGGSTNPGRALAAMLSPTTYQAVKFNEAWRDTLLYSEHTWGAWCSVSDSENPFTKEAVRREARIRGECGETVRAPSRRSPTLVYNRRECFGGGIPPLPGLERKWLSYRRRCRLPVIM